MKFPKNAEDVWISALSESSIACSVIFVVIIEKKIFNSAVEIILYEKLPRACFVCMLLVTEQICSLHQVRDFLVLPLWHQCGVTALWHSTGRVWKPIGQILASRDQPKVKWVHFFANLIVIGWLIYESALPVAYSYRGKGASLLSCIFAYYCCLSSFLIHHWKFSFRCFLEKRNFWYSGPKNPWHFFDCFILLEIHLVSTWIFLSCFRKSRKNWSYCNLFPILVTVFSFGPQHNKNPEGCQIPLVQEFLTMQREIICKILAAGKLAKLIEKCHFLVLLFRAACVVQECNRTDEATKNFRFFRELFVFLSEKFCWKSFWDNIDLQIFPAFHSSKGSQTGCFESLSIGVGIRKPRGDIIVERDVSCCFWRFIGAKTRWEDLEFFKLGAFLLYFDCTSKEKVTDLITVRNWHFEYSFCSMFYPPLRKKNSRSIAPKIFFQKT